MRNLAFAIFTSCLLTIAAAPALGQSSLPDTLPLGTQLNAVAMNAGAAALTVTVGPHVRSGMRKYPVARYKFITMDVAFDYATAAGAISMTCTGGDTVANATRSLTSCTESAGNCTINFGGVATTASLSADTAWLIPVGKVGVPVVKCIFAHSGTPTSSELITVKAWLVL